MRLNKFIAQATGMSRRAADRVIAAGRVTINEQVADVGQLVQTSDNVKLDQKNLVLTNRFTTIILHKPVGYVCSRRGQGSQTIYDLLPPELHALKPIGRLDKDSSGLLLLTNDGQLANHLTHPRYQKAKIYAVKLDRPIDDQHLRTIKHGVALEDGPSHLKVELANQPATYTVTMHEGRNRQIRRSFAALGYSVKQLHRLSFGSYQLSDLAPGQFKEAPAEKSQT